LRQGRLVIKDTPNMDLQVVRKELVVTAERGVEARLVRLHQHL